MESAFSFDFATVRVHTGPAAHDAASSLGARALTAGTDILFRAGEYLPGTTGGDRLLAHELAHVVQQAHGLPQGILDTGATDQLEKSAGLAADHASPAAEREAHGAAMLAVMGEPVPVLSRQPPTIARRDNLDDPRTQPDASIPDSKASLPSAPAAPAAPVPSAGPARPVFFCSKNVALGRKHAFFSVGGAGPGNHTYELEHDDLGDHCPCGMQGIPRRDYREDQDSADATCVSAPSISATCLAQQYDAYPKGNYCIWGPNSNTYARVIAEACGGTGLRPPGNLPGFFHAPPVAGTASPTWEYSQLFGCVPPISCGDASCQEIPEHPLSSGYYNG